MNIKERPCLEKQASKYKRFLETYENFTYSLMQNDKHFYYLSYYRFNKCKGIAILHDGEQPSNLEIQTAFKTIYNFNRIICEARDTLLPDMKRPVSVFQELKLLLNRLNFISAISLNKVNDELKEINSMASLMIEFPQDLLEIFKEIQAIEKTVLNRTYLLKEDVDRAMELNFLHCKIMYNQGREQLNGIENARVLIRHLKGQVNKLSDNDKYNVKLLLKHLELFSQDKAIRELNRSQSTFEKDEHGNKVTFSPGEKGLQELKETFYKKVDHILDNHIKNYLRNL